MRKRSLPLILLLVFTGLLLTFPQESAAAAREGLAICAELIIPSLFPFFVLSSLFVSMGYASLAGKYLQRLMKPLFRVSGACSSALLLGAIGGYPVGIRTTATLYESGQCSRADALRLSAFCNNCGPAFLISVAGVGVFSSKEVGFLLLGTHLAAALAVGLLFRFYPTPKEKRSEQIVSLKQEDTAFSAVFPTCVKDSFFSTLNVCAFVVLFSVLLRLATCSGLLPLCAKVVTSVMPKSFTVELCQSLIAGIFELSTGIYTLSESSTSFVALPLAAFILGWGGLSVHCQSLPFLNHTVSSLLPYFAGKLLQGLLAALFTACLAPLLLPTDIPAAALVETAFFWTSSHALLLRQELLALFALSGGYFLLFGKKRLEM